MKGVCTLYAFYILLRMEDYISFYHILEIRLTRRHAQLILFAMAFFGVPEFMGRGQKRPPRIS